MLRFLILISLFVCVNSCKEQTRAELIVGDWRQLKSEETISFYKDGTCTSVSPQGSWNGTYKLVNDGKRIIVTPSEIKDSKKLEPSTDPNTTTSTTVTPTYKTTTDPHTSLIVELTSDKLIIAPPPEDGGNSEQTIFVRDKEK